MKVIAKSSDSISTKDVTTKHLIVAKIKGDLCILLKSSHLLYNFLIISNSIGGSIITSGNAYNLDNKARPLHEFLEECFRTFKSDIEIHAYEPDKYAVGLQWLLDQF